MNKFIALLAAGLLTSTAFAAGQQSQVVEKPLVAQTLDAFTQESAHIREQMQPGGLYGYIKSSDKARVENRLDSMFKLLQAHSGDSGMPQSDKIALVNAQEEVNGILRHNDINRLVCESRAPVGSHIPITTCRTYGEIELTRQTSIKSVNDMSNASRNARPGN
jgi:hypothetical protein